MSTQHKNFIKGRLHQAVRRAWSAPAASISAVMLTGALMSSPVMAQQVGGITGKVSTQVAGVSVSDVTVTATSNVMPRPRTVTTKADGSYNLPALLPGEYTLTFTSADGTVRKTTVEVFLDQSSNVNIVLDGSSAASGDTEIILITGSTLVQKGNSSLTNSISADVIKGVPVGQDYRDLFKLIPGVQYSENTVLGPSAGGSGVDNKYGFDGVNVSLPLFGNLASEPSTHDVAYVSMDRGGAKAVGFNRSGGFAMNTTSKSGTNEFHGNLEYKIQDKSMVAAPVGEETYNLDKSWLTASLSGPLIEDQLFFYASYYRPEVTRENKETAYGEVKNYKSERDEYFGKLTWAPTDDLLFNISQRSSQKTIAGRSIGSFETDSVSVGDKADQDIFTFDGSWLLNDYTTLSFSYSTFELKSSGTPDNILSVVPSFTGTLDVNNLDQMGYFNVPNLDSALDSTHPYNLMAQSLIDKYGYLDDNGARAGGGGVGGFSQIDESNFYRDAFELNLDHEMEMGSTLHNIHIGFQWSEGREELIRTSNGWGSISYFGGKETISAGGSDVPYFFRALTQQMSFDNTSLGLSAINSEIETYNFEINDTIEHGAFTYNVGVLISQDTLYGQGLAPTSANDTGLMIDPGNKYKMYTIDWQDMIQPRLGVTWAYEDQNTIFANFASYNPDASSLPRAASFDRNFIGATIETYFDASGNIISSIPRESSGGKFFADDLKPRRINEFTVGTTKILNDEWQLRSHIRHRKATHFWEDMPNNSRLTAYPDSATVPGVPADIAAKGLYIPNLADIYSDLGLGANPNTAYVIAEVDGGFTKYWEASFEAEYHGDRTYLNASYVWSHYYGNFDQDNTTATTDANTFVGSSNYGDGRGRFVWDNKYGTLRGDKPHIFKAYGTYTTDWDANIGAYLLFQSGQAWEKWDPVPYGYSSAVSATARYGEPAGSRRTASHWQLDLNYTQDFQLTDTFIMNFRADLFNVFDRQTGYNINPYAYQNTYGDPRSYYNSRRLQLSVNVAF